MRNVKLGSTLRFNFTTRAFDTGIPTALLGSPVLSVLEEDNATPITAGVSVSVDRASVGGLNQATIVATTGNGYEVGKYYSVYISTGTVDSVSVVGEVVAEFTVEERNAVLQDSVRHGGTAALVTLERIVVASTTTTEPAIKAIGNTSGDGIEATGGTTGNGMSLIGGSSSGDGLDCSVTSGSEIDADINGTLSTLAAALRSALGTNDSDVIAELPQGIPPATPTPAQAAMLAYMLLRNKAKVSTNLLSILNNAAAVITKATVSDFGSVFTKDELVSGP